MKIISVLFMAASVAAIAAPKGEFIANGHLMLDNTLAEKAKGIHTVFVSVYDAKAQGGMPLGATKVAITKDAKGKFTDFTLDTGTMMMMGGGALPNVVNIKAKLDKDGSAGPDSSGDLVGWAKDVKVGTHDITVRIDSAVP